MAKVLSVWTNGNAVRKYIGQDKHKYIRKTSKESGWYKRVAILMTEEEYQEYQKEQEELKEYKAMYLDLCD